MAYIEILKTGVVMNKEYVIIVGASQLVMPAFKIAKEDLNLGTIAFDYNPEAPGMIYADIPINVSTKDIEKCVDIAQKLSTKCKIIGAFTEGADVEVTVSVIAEKLNLPAVSLEVAQRCNNKLLMHKCLDKKNFKDKAKYILVENENELSKITDFVDFPCVIKPIDNCASRGVFIVDSLSELHENYKKAKKYNISKKNKNGVIVEEYLEGTKHTVEMITYNGQWHLLSIIDTHYISRRIPCETGLNTTLLDRYTQSRLYDFAKNVAKIVGIDFNAHKVDVNLSKEGDIKLIEMTTRLSGGFHCQYVSPLAYGSNDIRAALKLAVGQPLCLSDIEHKYERGAAVEAIFPKPGTIKSIKNIEKAKSMRGVKEIFILKNIGNKVGPYKNSSDRVAFVIADGNTTLEAIENAQRAKETVKIETE